MREFEPSRLDLYVVTSGTLGTSHRAIADAAIAGGATAIQLRAPELTDEELLPVATELAALCRRAGVLFVVNDRIEVALRAGADGVHVGQDDDPSGAREKLGPDPVLGVSVEGAEQARLASRSGADYVAVTVWQTETKPEAAPRGVAGVREVARASDLPVVGIGGIGPGNALEVLAAGAQGIAVISAVAIAPDPVGVTRELREIVEVHRMGKGWTNR